MTVTLQVGQYRCCLLFFPSFSLSGAAELTLLPDSAACASAACTSAACGAEEATLVASEVPSDSSEAGGEPSGATLPDSSAGDSSAPGISPRLLHSPSGSCRPLASAGGRERKGGKGEKRRNGQKGKVLCA